MSIKKPSQTPDALDPDIAARHAVLARFQLSDIQHLESDDLATAQQLIGHGDTLGQWRTEGYVSNSTFRNIDLARRIRSWLRNFDPDLAEGAHCDLISEGVSTLTRLGVLMRMTPTRFGKGSNRSRPLKSSTVAQYMYDIAPKLLARAILRAMGAAKREHGLLRCFNAEDLAEIGDDRKLSRELSRLDTLAAMRLWWDVPEKKPLLRVTDPGEPPVSRKPPREKIPFPPLDDAWLMETGPRVLWVVNELAPNLLRLLERLPNVLIQVNRDLSKGGIQFQISSMLQSELQREPWLDSLGRPLEPPFRFMTSASASRHKTDPYEWPIRTWQQVCMLSTTVQAAHMFIALLATAGRIGEDRTLARFCVEMHADGQHFVHGRTYKLNHALFGDQRTWPAPAMLVKALGQQARLAAAWDWLPVSQTDAMPSSPQFDSQLWVSIGTHGHGQGIAVTWLDALLEMAKRLGVNPRPGGKNVHPHRFRKTVARLAGIALWNSPIVIKQLLGHKDIEMTLHYILSDPGIREEAEKVLRELRVMHCAETLQQVRDAVKSGLPNPFGGVGGTRLVSAVIEHEARERQSQRQWTTDTPYELAVDYTMNGKGWRLGTGFICSKLPHEAGECRKGASRRGEHGEPLISNCKRTCAQRIDLPEQIAKARQERDVEEVCDGYVAIATKACADGQLLVAAGCLKQLNEELEGWPDLKSRYDASPDVQALFVALEPQDEAEVAHG